MNIKTTIATVGVALWAFLLFMGTASAAVIAITDKPTFDFARSSAEWNNRVRMASSENEFGMANGGALAPLTDDHEAWSVKASFSLHETVTMPISIISDGTTLTFSLGDVTSSTHGLFAESSSIDLTGFNSFTTLWVGLESIRPDNSFRMINTALNGENIAMTEANGINFSGIQIPVGESFSFITQLQTEHVAGSPQFYSLSDAGFYAFGDNTLAHVPEPSSVILLGLSSAAFLFRRKRG